MQFVGVVLFVWWYWLTKILSCLSQRHCDSWGRSSFWRRPVILVFPSDYLTLHMNLAALSRIPGNWSILQHKLIVSSGLDLFWCSEHVAYDESKSGVAFSCCRFFKWMFQLVMVSSVTPRYLICSAVGISVLCRWSFWFEGCRLREIVICWYLDGWNSMFPSVSQFSHVLRFFWSSWWFIQAVVSNSLVFGSDMRAVEMIRQVVDVEENHCRAYNRTLGDPWGYTASLDSSPSIATLCVRLEGRSSIQRWFDSCQRTELVWVKARCD